MSSDRKFVKFSFFQGFLVKFYVFCKEILLPGKIAICSIKKVLKKPFKLTKRPPKRCSSNIFSFLEAAEQIICRPLPWLLLYCFYFFLQESCIYGHIISIFILNPDSSLFCCCYKKERDENRGKYYNSRLVFQKCVRKLTNKVK